MKGDNSDVDEIDPTDIGVNDINMDEPDMEYDEVQQYQHLDYLEALLGSGELNNHFEQDLKARRYYCPQCTLKDGILVYENGKVEEYPASKWAVLCPNTPDSEALECIVCGGMFDIKRKNCNPT